MEVTTVWSYAQKDTFDGTGWNLMNGKKSCGVIYSEVIADKIVAALNGVNSSGASGIIESNADLVQRLKCFKFKFGEQLFSIHPQELDFRLNYDNGFITIQFKLQRI